MKKNLFAMPVVVALASSFPCAPAHAQAVAGIALYPGASSKGVEGSEKVLHDTGYPTAVCRHTGDSLDQVVRFYRADKQLSLLGEPTKDNAGFASKTGASMSINSPWVDMGTMKMNSGTLICIVSKNGK